jgi:hypothetical protein
MRYENVVTRGALPFENHRYLKRIESLDLLGHINIDIGRKSNRIAFFGLMRYG